MTKPRKRRPMAFDSLENRLVLSSGVSSAASTQVQDARQVQQEIRTFNQAYNQDFRTILYGADSGGAINPTANRAAFDAQVAKDLATLNTSIAATVSNLSDGATLAATIQGEILGTGTGTLQGQLAALATPSGAYNASTRLFQADSSSAIRITGNEVTQQVRADTSSTTTTTTPTTSPTSAQLSAAVQATSSAFQTFRSSYGTDVSTILYAADASGTISPTANRAAFDAQVTKDLATLSTSVTTALSALPTSTALVAQAQADLSGASNSLQSELAALSTPTGPYTTSARVFSSASQSAESSAQSSILSAVSQAYGSSVGGGGFGLGFGGGHGGFGGSFGNLFRHFFGHR